MNQRFEIFGKPVGAGAPCFLIAEAGSNHNGSLEQAHALIDAAAEAGACAVKFQTFSAKRLYPRSAGTSDYLGDARSIYDIIASLETPSEWWPGLSARAHRLGLAFLSSPFHEEAVALLDPYVDAFKIASYEMTHVPLLREVARTGKPVIMSTGASTLDEVERAVAAVRDAGCRSLVVLQCTASYPSPLASINVRALVTMRDALGVPTGLSDHSSEPAIAPMAAAALGASVIEKHYTLSRRLPGPDHAFAIEPAGLAELVRGVRAIEQSLGTGEKIVQPVEDELRQFARRALFTTRAVKQGELLTRENLDVLRRGKRGDGLPPERLDEVLGKPAARDLEAEALLAVADVAGLA
jgi:N,N'-diacetyllegionaminate synthase